jgi:predicted dehydrogenase
MTLFEHESGAVSNVTTCFTSPDIFSMKLHGTEAAVHLEMIRENIVLAERTNEETTLKIEKKGETGWTYVPLPSMTDMVQDELEEFASCARSGAAPETGPAEAVYALAMVEGSVRSAEEGRPLEMAALLDGIEV